MRIDILTLFPEMFAPVLGESMLGRAAGKGLLTFHVHDIRAYADNKHRKADDYPFGGGAGLVMLAQPIVDAFRAIGAGGEGFAGRRICLSPRGAVLSVDKCRALAGEERLVLLCGHYEGIDQRALDLCVDEELSIGDYILTGGELPAMVLIDAVSRFIPGVLGSEASREEESLMDGLLEYPQYTRPAEFEGIAVPEVLLSGHHANIVAWRREQAIALTAQRRPDLLAQAGVSDKERALLARQQQTEENEAR